MLREAYEESGLLADVAERATRYLSEIDERRVFPARDALAALSAFDVPLQEHPISPADVVDLDRLASPATTAIAGPRFFGFVSRSGLPAAVAANWLSTAWAQHGAFWVLSPAATRIEQVALRWTIELLGLPAESAGAFVTGTTMAHVAGLAAARSSLLGQVGWNVEADGLFGAPPITVIVGAEAHRRCSRGSGSLGSGGTG